jgi:hypothetical protein
LSKFGDPSKKLGETKKPLGLISSDYMIGTKKHEEKSFMKEFEDAGAIW